MRTGDLTQRYHGMYLAEVVDVEDPEKLGRVRVKADQFEDTMDQPVWASVARPSAGDGTGVFFTPKAGDHVVLGYVVGDVREPLILGYAHSQQRKPDTKKVDAQKHAIVTKIGSLTFDEKDGKIVVTFEGPLKSIVTLDKNGIVLEADGPTKSVVTLDKTGITLEGPAVTIKAPTISLGATPSPPPPPGASPGGLTVNGKGLVLETFISEAFVPHVHSTTVPPPAPAFAPTTTPWLSSGSPVPITQVSK
jgi:hypothetical protein